MTGKVVRAAQPGPGEEQAVMSTVTRERGRTPLPQTARGDAVLAAIALLACLLALAVKMAGIA